MTGAQSDPAFIGRRVREERLRVGMPQAELGRRVGLKAPTSMMKYEKGESAFSAEMLIQIANILRVSVEAFTREADAAPRYEPVVDGSDPAPNAMALEAVLRAIDYFDAAGAPLTPAERGELEDVAPGMARKGGRDALLARLVRLVRGWRLERTTPAGKNAAEAAARQEHDLLLQKDKEASIVQLKAPKRSPRRK